jgi:hypothetical protein
METKQDGPQPESAPDWFQSLEESTRSEVVSMIAQANSAYGGDREQARLDVARKFQLSIDQVIDVERWVLLFSSKVTMMEGRGIRLSSTLHNPHAHCWSW